LNCLKINKKIKFVKFINLEIDHREIGGRDRFVANPHED